jgi:hypothetical protein
VKKDYDFVKASPVAKFYYKGNHSHPIRRTVIITDSTPTLIRGYEVREGSITRLCGKAPIKSYRKTDIAKIGQCGRRLRKRTPSDLHESTTLTRLKLVDFVKQGA